MKKKEKKKRKKADVVNLLCKKVIHVFREANQYTNALTRFGANSDPSFVVFENPLPVVASLLAFDLSDMYCKRLIFS